MSGRIPKSNDELREKYFNEKKIEFETVGIRPEASLTEFYSCFRLVIKEMHLLASV